MTPAEAEAAVDAVQGKLASDAPPEFTNLLFTNEELLNAVSAFRDCAVAGLIEGLPRAELKRRLDEHKTNVVSLIPEGGPAFRATKLMIAAIDALTQHAASG